MQQFRYGVGLGGGCMFPLASLLFEMCVIPKSLLKFQFFNFTSILQCNQISETTLLLWLPQ